MSAEKQSVPLRTDCYPIKICVSTGAIYPEWQATGRTSTLTSVALNAGFDGMELNPLFFELHDFTVADLDTRKLTLHSCFNDSNIASVNPYIRKASVAQILDELTLCRKHTIPTLTLHPGKAKYRYRTAALGLLKDSLSQILSARQEGDPLICLENMDHKSDKLCNTVEELSEILETFPDLRMTADLAHIAMTETDVEQFLDIFEQRIVHLHISGYRKNCKHQDISLVESTVDLVTPLKRFMNKKIKVVIENGPLNIALASRNAIVRFLTGRQKESEGER